jgi:hypothetical protein
MDAPLKFRQFDTRKEYKLITADGVMLKARKVDNYPEASLSFWKDAMTEHLKKQGYILEKSSCFKTLEGRDGCTLKFDIPNGAEDWSLYETIFVIDKDILLVEAAGEFVSIKKLEADLERAFKTVTVL